MKPAKKGRTPKPEHLKQRTIGTTLVPESYVLIEYLASQMHAGATRADALRELVEEYRRKHPETASKAAAWDRRRARSSSGGRGKLAVAVARTDEFREVPDLTSTTTASGRKANIVARLEQLEARLGVGTDIQASKPTSGNVGSGEEGDRTLDLSGLSVGRVLAPAARIHHAPDGDVKAATRSKVTPRRRPLAAVLQLSLFALVASGHPAVESDHTRKAA
jgi:hypothetical protein